MSENGQGREPDRIDLPPVGMQLGISPGVNGKPVVMLVLHIPMAPGAAEKLSGDLAGVAATARRLRGEAHLIIPDIGIPPLDDPDGGRGARGD